MKEELADAFKLLNGEYNEINVNLTLSMKKVDPAHTAGGVQCVLP